MRARCLGIEPDNKGRAIRLIGQCEDQFGRQKKDYEGESEPGSETIRSPVRIVFAELSRPPLSYRRWSAGQHRSRRCHSSRLVLAARGL